jgi:retron-type reverse transcriptase
MEEAFYALTRQNSNATSRICMIECNGERIGLPSRRVYIPKPDGRQRPLAVAALEDKIVQRSVVALLNAIYEEDFRGFSYGFRPGRGAHDALDALCVGIHGKKVSSIVDADIRSFLDPVSYCPLVHEACSKSLL